MNHPARPLLIYDGDCAFCFYWVRYWRVLTGDRVRFAPYQQVAGDYPQIPPHAFQSAVQYISPEGRIASAAEASFLTLRHAPGKGFWLELYRRLPGFAWLSEKAYAFIAAHRSLAYRVTLLLWGRDFTPPRHTVVSELFLRALGLVFLAAFVSMAVQVLGLVGSHGILPLSEYLSGLREALGPAAYYRFPNIFWVNASNTALSVCCWLGAALSTLLVLGVLPRLVMPLLIALYLSLFYAGQVFTQFQWDLLLIESGFLAMALQTGSGLALWLGRWLVFRFMLLSGAVKLLSGDPTWANLTALSYHFETQPLPTPLAWYAHHLPQPWLTAFSAGHFAIELGLVFLIFFPRRLRLLAAWGIVLLQALIVATGNYNFFNLLVLALSLLLFDDAALGKVLPNTAVTALAQRLKPMRPGRAARRIVAAYAAVVVAVGATQIYQAFARRQVDGPFGALMDFVAPLRAVNPYGVFANMVTERLEIVVEGTMDGLHWKEYRFRYKPGDVAQVPRWVVPHQPRLDWQMWFAALGDANGNPWFARFLLRLLENSPPVVALLADNPFPDQPAVAVRALSYRYRFSTPEEKRKGIWWERTQAGIYYPALSRGRSGEEPDASGAARRPALIDSIIRQR